MASLKFLPFAGTALKNLFSKPVTTSYPFAPAQYPERMRGHIEIDIENCISCGMCARSCPPGALTVDRAAGTWTIQRFDCVQCGNCVNVCPKKCLKMAPGYTTPDTTRRSDTFTRTTPLPKPAPRPAAKPAAPKPAAAGAAAPAAPAKPAAAPAPAAPAAPEAKPETKPEANPKA